MGAAKNYSTRSEMETQSLTIEKACGSDYVKLSTFWKDIIRLNRNALLKDPPIYSCAEVNGLTVDFFERVKNCSSN